MAKKKYYACKYKNGSGGIIFDNWEECAQYIKGKNVLQKSFNLKEEAEQFIGLEVKMPIIELQTNPVLNPNQKATCAVPRMSVDEYCKKYDFDYLSKEQREAVGTLDGKALLFAVPGSGKTTVIMARTGYLVHACNVNPDEIVALTFTKAAANEMSSRYYSKFKNESGAVSFKTIHSFCWSVILPKLRAAGFNYPTHLIGGTNKVKTEKGTITQIKIIKSVLRDCCNYNNTNDEVAQNRIINLITGIKNCMVPPRISKDDIRIYLYYQKLLCENDAMDFDDMLRYAYKGLCEYPEVLFDLQERYKYWSIDEAQDNSELQYKLLELLVGEKGNLFMVGDDDQSIYSFRAAKPSLMFKTFGAQPGVKKIYMSTNYRSDKAIVNSAKYLIQANKFREPKEINYRENAAEGRINVTIEFPNERNQYEYIIDQAIKARKENKSVAVLYRLNASCLPLIFYLHKNNIPYKASKSLTDLLSGLMASRVLAIMECSQNQRKFETVYHKLSKLGIYLDKRKYTEDMIRKACEENPSKTVLENIKSIISEDSSNFENVDSCNELLIRIENMVPADAITAIISNTNNLFNDEKAKKISARLKLCTLLSSTEQFSTIREFLTAIKEIKEKEKPVLEFQNTDLHEEDASVCTSDKPVVFLSSIHSAKGREFERVILIDYFDVDMSEKKPEAILNYDPEEELRVFYVAITRAIHQIDILSVSEYHGVYEPLIYYVTAYKEICQRIGIQTGITNED